MDEMQIRAVEMVRAIRDAMNDETEGFSREELKRYFAQKAAAFRSRQPSNQATRTETSPAGLPPTRAGAK